ncbi:MAG: NusB antitermination factor [Cytophagaceae bacterium]|nr:NusB antitermination factor [Cytophagaceae bacterium]
MLNRRLLRIKAMQALYALDIARQSNFEMGTELLEEFFAPDMNTMEPQDKGALKAQCSQADKWYRQVVEESKQVEEHTDPTIVKAAAKALAQYRTFNENDRKHFQRVMLRDVDEVYKEYLSILNLLVSLAVIAEEDQAHEKNKHISKNIPDVFFKLQQNKVLLELRDNARLQELWARHKADFPRDAAKTYYKEYLLAMPEYKLYQEKAHTDLEEDRAIISDIFKNSILKAKHIEDVLESDDLNWIENKAIVKGMVVKTLKSVGTLTDPDQLVLEISLNWEEDKQYFKDIYDNTVKNDEPFEALIHAKVQNWDMERLAVLDKIILKMALAEMMYCPSIPVKVSINEFIELSKTYSTPKSKQFVNGLLDKISAELMAEGKIRKSGRGLIDNK